MSTPFSPIQELELFCRFCGKVMPAQLDRSIAQNGRTVDRNSTFEYYCSKCFKTACYCGADLVELSTEEAAKEKETREYVSNSHFFIGERIRHKKFKEYGVIVGKDNGVPSRILVQFEKSGLRKLVQDL